MVTCHIVAYLFSAAVGYWVLTLAGKEKNFTKKVGCVVGWAIMVTSLVGLLCIATNRLFCHGYSSCSISDKCTWGTGHGMWNCPDMIKNQGATEDLGKGK